jgi:DNA-binding MarR family transcriptional regulator
MAELSNAAVERLLLLMSDYGQIASAAMMDASPDPELVSDASVVVLCSLDLDGPRRPGVLQQLTGLSSGGVSKLLDRMESAGVVKRAYGGVPGDNRGVLVSITRRGRALMSRFSAAVANQLPESRALVKEISGLLEA